jgi:hypothetical protein
MCSAPHQTLKSVITHTKKKELKYLIICSDNSSILEHYHDSYPQRIALEIIKLAVQQIDRS